MKIKQVLFKNFKSYGNNITEVNFDDQSSLNLLVGSNGSGKSSIPECITYMLYGQCGYTKAEIANRYNKKFWGKVTLECDGHLIEIERSLSPDTFTASIDGVNIDDSSKNKLQDTLESYYKVPYFIFTNLININADVSILGMNAANRKKLIDNILNLAVIDEIRKAVKSKLNVADRELKDKQSELRGANAMLEKINTTKSDEGSIDQRLKCIAEELAEFSVKMTKIKDSITELESVIETKKDETSEKQDVLNKITEKVNQVKSSIKYSKGILEQLDGTDTCPICGTSSDSHNVKEHINELKSGIEKDVADLKKYVEKYNLAYAELDKFMKDKTDTEEKLNKYRIAEVSLNSIIEKLRFEESSLNDRKKEAETQLNSTKTLVESLQRDIDGNLTDNVTKYSSMLNVVDDSNLRQHLTSRYVKYINDAVNQIINVSTYYITFDPSDFSAEIMNAGKKVTFNSLSRGEKRKLDFCVILGLLEVVRSQVGNINLLFLDELFANVDVDATNDLMSALKVYCNKMPGLQLFVVHHAELNNSVFDNVFDVHKDSANFSVIELKNI